MKGSGLVENGAVSFWIKSINIFILKNCIGRHLNRHFDFNNKHNIDLFQYFP